MGPGLPVPVFLPPTPPTYTSDEPTPVTLIPTPSGNRIATFFLSPSSKKTESRTTILYCHDSPADLGSIFQLATILAEGLSVHIMCFDYLGYGLSRAQDGTEEIEPSEEGACESVESCLEWLLNVRHVRFEDIIVYGSGLGSGPATFVAAKYRRIRGLILESAFVSVEKPGVPILSQIIPSRKLFRNSRKIGQCRCPVMMFHGRVDSIVPFGNALELWTRVSEELQFRNVWVDEADHYNVIDTITVDAFISHLLDFVRHCDQFVQTEDRMTETATFRVWEFGRGGFVQERDHGEEAE